MAKDDDMDLYDDDELEEAEGYDEEDEMLEEELGDDGDDPVMELLAAAMPWVISLLFHVGLFLVLLFLVFIVYSKPEEEEVYFASTVQSHHPGGRVNPTQRKVQKHTSSEARKSVVPKKSQVNVSSGKTDETLDVTGIAGGGKSGASANGLSTHGTGLPNSGFFGSGGKAYNIVYVIDRSGSMIDTFDALRREMRRSIYALDDSQNFHVIFYSEDEPEEFGTGRLVPATRLNKKKVAEYLQDVVPRRQTNPVPALQRAFDVFKGARKKGFLVYLLTDGRFPDNQKVLDAIKKMNPDGKVQIFTYLYGNRPPEAVEIMKNIASENNGLYKYVRESGY